MKKIQNNIRNAGVTKIEFDPDTYSEFKKKLFTALKKFSSSKKTRAVHKLIDQDIVKMGTFSGEANDRMVIKMDKANRLAAIILSSYYFDDSLDQYGVASYANQLQNIDKQIQKEKTFISEKQIYNLEQLEKNKKEIQEKLLKSIDYIKAVDGIYFGWLYTLADYVMEKETQNKPKIVTLTADILAATLKKVYSKLNHKIEPEVHQLIEAIAIYFIRIYYYGESSTYVLNILKKAFDEETIEAIQMSKIKKFEDFGDIANILKETDLMPITKPTFNMEMERMFGKYGYNNYISTSLVDFIVFMANLSNRTQLFENAYPVDDEMHERLEELLLNAQKFINIEAY